MKCTKAKEMPFGSMMLLKKWVRSDEATLLPARS